MPTRTELLGKLGNKTVPVLLIEENQVTKDIIKQVVKKHAKCAADYDLIAPFFDTGDLYTTCERLYDFCKKNLPYIEESVNEQYVSAPTTILKRGYSDCKCYSLFCGGVLDALKRSGRKWNWCYRFVSNKILSRSPHHVFIVAWNSEYEVWLDPVLKEFDYRHLYFYSIDKKPMVQTKKIGCSDCGGTCSTNAMGSTSTTGAAIMKVAPALSAVPVAALAVEVVGLALTVFGSKYSDTTQQRWLIQLYQYYVLGQGNVGTDNKVNESYGPAGVSWFSQVLGVPVLDRSLFDALKGVKYGSATSLNQSYDTRAKIYLAQTKIVPYNIPLAQAVQAAMLADNLSYSAKPGGWAGAVAAPTIAFPPGTTGGGQEYVTPATTVSAPTVALNPVSTGTTLLTQPVVTVATAASTVNPIIWIALAGGALLLLTGKKNKKKKSAA